MLATLLQDGAIAAAKGFSHAAVEPRHVLYAAARHFRSKPEVEALLPQTKAALEPRGSALETPKITPEAEQLIAELIASQDIVATLIAKIAAAKTASPVATAAPPAEQQPGSTTQPVATPTPAPEKPVETVAEVLSELNQLTGLESVKRQFTKITAVVQANLERSKAGMAPVAPGLHLVFTGPPGTGKTTVARLVARLYAAAGALPGAKFTEAGRQDLVGGYIGQTALKTTDVINSTKPGVLFIDEAYSLTPSSERDFGSEAIATLVKAMEDYRNEFAVIAAGYGEEMEQFIASNPGLKSRFKTYIDFPDYSPDELVEIFAAFAKQFAIELEEGVLPAAAAIFRRASSTRDFGNARFARSLFEQAYARMAERAAADGAVHVDEVTKITVADLEYDDRGLDSKGRKIGFARE